MQSTDYANKLAQPLRPDTGLTREQREIAAEIARCWAIVYGAKLRATNHGDRNP